MDVIRAVAAVPTDGASMFRSVDGRMGSGTDLVGETECLSKMGC